MIIPSSSLPVRVFPFSMAILLNVVTDNPLMVVEPVKLTVQELWLNNPLFTQFPATPKSAEDGPVRYFPEFIARLFNTGGLIPLRVVLPSKMVDPELCKKPPSFNQSALRISFATDELMKVLAASFVSNPFIVMSASIICFVPAPFRIKLLYVVR
jgi:hypothetical protein